MTVVWTLKSQGDVHEIFAYIMQDKPAAAANVVARLMLAGNRLTEMPLRGRPGKSPGTRELVVTGLPYVLIYEVSGGSVFILRVMHGARLR